MANPDIDIVVELIGGTNVAKDLIMQAIENGKHVVTANKALLALHGNEIFAAAQKKGVMVAFEAAVAGGIPIIKALREGLTANRIEWIAGIINGTSNFILSRCATPGPASTKRWREAQRLGYAEADPTFDIEGIDAAHKLTIMAGIGFGIPMQFDKAYTEGISKLTRAGHPLRRGAGLPHQAAGHHAAHRQRHRAARASDADSRSTPDRQRRRRDERGLGEGRCGGRHDVLRRWRRRGADCFRCRRRSGRRDAHAYRRSRRPRAASGVSAGCAVRCADPADGRGGDLLLLAAARVGSPRCAGRYHAHPGRPVISIDAMVQKEPGEGEEQVDIIMLTHLTLEKNVNAAIARIEALPVNLGKVTRIRLEELAA